MLFRLSVPGNLLLCGEYAILEPGGLGLCLACAPRVRLAARPARRFSLVSVFAGQTRRGLDGLPSFVWEGCRAHLGPGTALPAYACRSDSRVFFGPGGEKLGFGSSAAVAVGLAALFLAPFLGPVEAARLALPVALAAHRAFQGGRGSGYDVHASFHGGCGVFAGGDVPDFRPLVLPAGIRVFTLRGPRPQSSGSAAGSYRALRAADRAVTGRFLPVSNRLVRRVAVAAAAGDASAFLAALAATALPGRWIGQRLGIPAEPPGLGDALAGLRRAGWVAKASGAGGETGLVAGLDGPVAGNPENRYLFDMDQPRPGCIPVPVTVAETGLTWL